MIFEADLWRGEGICQAPSLRHQKTPDRDRSKTRYQIVLSLAAKMSLLLGGYTLLILRFHSWRSRKSPTPTTFTSLKVHHRLTLPLKCIDSGCCVVQPYACVVLAIAMTNLSVAMVLTIVVSPQLPGQEHVSFSPQITRPPRTSKNSVTFAGNTSLFSCQLHDLQEPIKI